MKCPQCGSAGFKARRESIRGGDFLGLPNVTLANVEVSQCDACGAREIAVPKIEKLNMSIAHFLAQKHQRLDGDEVRFLRKYLGWSGADFASALGVQRETVSRWENGKEDMNPGAERALRLAVALFSPIEDYSIDALTEIDKAKSKPNILRAEVKRAEWELTVA